MHVFKNEEKLVNFVRKSIFAVSRQLFCLFLFRREKENGNKEKLKRNYVKRVMKFVKFLHFSQFRKSDVKLIVI